MRFTNLIYHNNRTIITRSSTLLPTPRFGLTQTSKCMSSTLVGRVSILSSRFPVLQFQNVINRETSSHYLNVHSILRRCYSAKPKFNSQRIASEFRQKDRVPGNYELIYRLGFKYPIITIQVLDCIALFTGISVLVQAFFPKHVLGGDGAENRDKILQKSEESIVFVQRPDTESLPVPNANEMLDLPLEHSVILAVALIGLMVGLIRIQRMLPIRIYTSASGHCYAIFYGHMIPGRTTRHEFVAGTIKVNKRQSPFTENNSVFVDATGKSMIILDHCFRTQSDFKFLQGVTKKLHDDDE